MADEREDVIKIDCELVHETEKAWLLDLGESEHWFPKSKCEYEDGTLSAPRWLLEVKGLDPDDFDDEGWETIGG